MKLHCIFIACFVLFALCSLASSQNSQGPNKCCFSYSNVRIPLKAVNGYFTTHLECHRSGIVFITKAGNEICTNFNERWVQRLKNMVDARNLKETSDDSS
nr:C-C motif chemokine 14-like [Misgurnus anguillicaudatus]